MVTIAEMAKSIREGSLGLYSDNEVDTKVKVFQTWAGSSKDEVISYLAKNTDLNIFRAGVLWLDRNGHGDLPASVAVGLKD